MEVAIFLKIIKRGGGETHLIILEGATYLLYCSYQTLFSGFQNFECIFTFTCIMGKMIHANTPILTRSITFTIARFPRAKGYFSFTLTSSKTSSTGTLI